MDRKFVFKALVGSHNYNLNVDEIENTKTGERFPTSDRDYKVFVLPTFEDLYKGNMYDIRKLPNILYKANINFIEVLFSNEIIINDELGREQKLMLSKIFENKDEIARMNLPRLYNSCSGMFLNKMKLLKKGTDGTQHLVDTFGYDCYSEDTEFLTYNGWKKYDEVTERDFLATVNPVSKKVEYQQYFDRIKKEFNGVLYELDNAYTNCLVTGNHRMFVSEIKNRNKNGTKYIEDNSNWHYDSMENLINGSRSFYHVLTTPTPNQEDVNVDEDYLKLIGLYISEGTMNKFNNKTNLYRSVRISQTKNGKKEVFDIMDSMPKEYGFNKYEYDRETVWVSYNKNIVSSLYNNCGHKNKRIPKWAYMLSKKQLDILINSLYLGDGTRKIVDGRDYGIVYYTNSKELAGDIQAISLLSGRDSLVWGGEKGYKSKSNFNGNNLYMYQIYIKDELSTPKSVNFKKFTDKSQGYIKGIKEIKYNGNIVCFSVPNENLITRRNGKVAIQGNTKQALYAYRVLDFIVRFANTDFEDFKKAMTYNEQEREFMLDIKHGFFTLESFENFVKFYYEARFKQLKEKYHLFKPNQELRDELDNIIMELVKLSL